MAQVASERSAEIEPEDAVHEMNEDDEDKGARRTGGLDGAARAGFCKALGPDG